MACDSPYYILPHKGATEKIPVPCGRCPPCKMRRVNEWVFRLLQEDKVATSSHFVTLTYDTEHVPISSNGFMTLCKKDVQDYMKRLRKIVSQRHSHNPPLKYYFAGEYGTQNRRPHYHAIIFNVPDIQYFSDAWALDGVQFGTVHVGKVSGDSVAYTMKYIDKAVYTKRHARDDRVPEFSLMSKGLGKSYLTQSIVDYHRSGSVLHLIRIGGRKVSMPRYYRNRIWSEAERKQQIGTILANIEIDEHRRRMEHFHTFGDQMTYEERKDASRIFRWEHFQYLNSKNRKL